MFRALWSGVNSRCSVSSRVSWPWEGRRSVWSPCFPSPVSASIDDAFRFAACVPCRRHVDIGGDVSPASTHSVAFRCWTVRFVRFVRRVEACARSNSDASIPVTPVGGESASETFGTTRQTAISERSNALRSVEGTGSSRDWGHHGHEPLDKSVDRVILRGRLLRVETEREPLPRTAS